MQQDHISETAKERGGGVSFNARDESVRIQILFFTWHHYLEGGK